MKLTPIVLLLSASVLSADDSRVLRTFQHEGIVRPVAFAPDGKLIATGSYDKKVRLWDAATGELRRDLGMSQPLLALTFAPDGKRIAAGTHQGELAVFQVETGKKLVTLKTGRGNVSGLAWSPDGSTLVTADYETTVTLWDAATGTQRKQLSGHSSRTWSVAFSPDGSVLASGGEDSLIRLWDPKSGKETGQLKGHTSGVGGVSFSRDGRLLVSASSDGSFRVWELLSGQDMMRMYGDSPHSAAFSPDGRLFVGATRDNSVHLFDIVNGRELSRLDGHLTWVLGVGVSPDGKQVVSSSQDRTARLWRLDGLAPARKQVQLTDEERERHWAALAGPDMSKVLQAMHALADDPATPAALEKHLKPVAVITSEEKKAIQEKLIGWIRDLDAKEAATRDRATAELEKVAELALPALRRANQKAASLEMLTRTAVLIDRCESLRIRPDSQRELRAVAILEWLGGEQAKALLKKLASGDAGAALTREATASLARLR